PPGSPGRWWSMTTAPAGLAAPPHSTAYTVAPSGTSAESATTRYALPGWTRWPVSSSAWTTCSPAWESRFSIICISGSGAPRTHTLCIVSSLVASRAQRARGGEHLIHAGDTRDPPLGGAGRSDFVRDGRQCGVRRIHRLAQRARCALRDAVLVAAVVSDDVSPAAPSPLDGRLPGAGPADATRRVPAGGLDDAPVHGVPAAAVASVTAHGVPPWCGVRGGNPVMQVPAPAEPAGLRLDRIREPVALPRPVMRGRQPPVSAPTADVDVGHTSLLLGLPVREAGLWTLRPRLGTEAAAFALSARRPSARSAAPPRGGGTGGTARSSRDGCPRGTPGRAPPAQPQ